MKAIIITSTNFPYGGAGANYIRLFAKGLVENGCDVNILLLKGYLYGNNRIKEKRINVFEKIKYFHCGLINRPFNMPGKLLDDILGITGSVLFLLFKSDRHTKVFIYNNEAHLHTPCFIAAKLLRCEIISFVPEGLEKANKYSSMISRISWCDFSLTMNFLNMKSSRLIVFSSFLRDFYTSRGYLSRNILIIPNLLDLGFFDHVELPVRKNNRFRIGYCGNPSIKDGISDLIDAFILVTRKDTDNELLIIGDSFDQNSVLSGLKEKLMNENLSDKVIFTGLISYKEVPDKLHSCDVLALARPSGIQAAAGFPTKLGEYLASGKPVVITKVGDMQYYFKDETDILFAQPDDPESVANKILWVKNNPGRAGKIAGNGSRWAKDNLDYRTNVIRIISFLKNRENH